LIEETVADPVETLKNVGYYIEKAVYFRDVSELCNSTENAIKGIHLQWGTPPWGHVVQCDVKPERPDGTAWVMGLIRRHFPQTVQLHENTDKYAIGVLENEHEPWIIERDNSYQSETDTSVVLPTPRRTFVNFGPKRLAFTVGNTEMTVPVGSSITISAGHPYSFKVECSEDSPDSKTSNYFAIISTPVFGAEGVIDRAYNDGVPQENR